MEGETEDVPTVWAEHARVVNVESAPRRQQRNNVTSVFVYLLQSINAADEGREVESYG